MPKKDRKPSAEKWFVYIVRCGDGTLYTGITKDVSRRCQQHNAGIASRYGAGSAVNSKDKPMQILKKETAPRYMRTEGITSYGLPQKFCNTAPKV